MYDKSSILKPESKIVETNMRYSISQNHYICETTFKSLTHLMNYISNTPLNVNNQNNQYDLASSRKASIRDSFYLTQNYEEALELLSGGYDYGVEQLKAKLECMSSMDNNFDRKIIQDVVGFQPIVSNYLMGIPQNMFNQKLVMKKQKVITINKCIDYMAIVPADKILEYSARTLRIIQELERKGYAINLNILDGYSCENGKEIIKVRIKNSNERLNLAKLAFPLLHPSMLRRIMFRYVEVSDTTPMRTSRSGGGSIGGCVNDDIYKQILKNEGEIFIERNLSEERMNSTIKLEL